MIGSASHDAGSLRLHYHFYWCGAGFPLDSAGAGLAVATGFPAAKAGRRKKCDLRVWRRINRRSANPVSVAILFVRHHLPNLRCRSDLSGSIRGGIHRFAGWSVHCEQYYLYAIIFLIFDVEAIFLVPFAVAFTGLPVGAFIAILIFLLLLIEGLVWAWGKGCLSWAAR